MRRAIRLTLLGNFIIYLAATVAVASARMESWWVFLIIAFVYFLLWAYVASPVPFRVIGRALFGG